MTITNLDLSQFTGTEQYYRHYLGLNYTDGIRYLAEEAGAFWLIDAIASYQTKGFLKDPDLLHFQLWELQVKDNTATLTCKKDSNKESVVSQFIEFTDFPLESIKLYVVDKVLMLPSEY